MGTQCGTKITRNEKTNGFLPRNPLPLAVGAERVAEVVKGMAPNPDGLQDATELNGELAAFCGPAYGVLFSEADVDAVSGNGGQLSCNPPPIVMHSWLLR